MPRPDLTDITLVLDRSGSMKAVKTATIEAFNGFVHSQRQGAGTAQLTLVQFDDQYEVVYSARPVAQAPELTHETYQPRASTALLDAMGLTMLKTGARLRDMPESERPGTVIFVTLTDGLENASTEYTVARINQMIALQRDTYSWQFVFLAANQDAIATAAAMGMGASQALTFAHSTTGTAACFGALDRQLHQVRAAHAGGNRGEQIRFTNEDREAAQGTGP